MSDNLKQVKKYLQSQTGRLMITYLAIIMTMTLLFSAVIYVIAASQIEHSLPPQIQRLDFFPRQQIEAIFQERANQARLHLVVSLGLLNLISLICGGIFSHYLARKTLEPIEVAMTAQKQFVTDASHELRTPLTALQTTNEVALRKKKLTLEDAKELMNHNILEVIKLRELSNSLLGLVKQESAAVSKNTFYIQGVINNVVSSLAPVANERNITIENKAPDMTVYANEAAVEQILTILIDNAIKYSPDGSKITLSAKQSAHDTRISITDQGIGIKKDQQAKIFDRFYRVDQSRSGRNVEGTGLGLSIAQAICERQGMRLAVKSAVGKGSTFVLHV